MGRVLRLQRSQSLNDAEHMNVRNFLATHFGYKRRTLRREAWEQKGGSTCGTRNGRIWY